MTKTRHDTVVLNTINRDRALQSKQGCCQYFLAIALQEIRTRKRWKRACKSSTRGLVASSTVREVDTLAFGHEFAGTSRSDFGRVYGGVICCRACALISLL